MLLICFGVCGVVRHMCTWYTKTLNSCITWIYLPLHKAWFLGWDYSFSKLPDVNRSKTQGRGVPYFQMKWGRTNERGSLGSCREPRVYITERYSHVWENTVTHVKQMVFFAGKNSSSGFSELNCVKTHNPFSSYLNSWWRVQITRKTKGSLQLLTTERTYCFQFRTQKIGWVAVLSGPMHSHHIVEEIRPICQKSILILVVRNWVTCSKMG